MKIININRENISIVFSEVPDENPFQVNVVDLIDTIYPANRSDSMLQQSAYIRIDLDIGEAVSLLRAENCLLRCVSGRLWVTEENGGGDILLDAGDAYLLTRRGRTVVQSVARQQGVHCQLTPAWSPRRIVNVTVGRRSAWPSRFGSAITLWIQAAVDCLRHFRSDELPRPVPSGSRKGV